MTDDGARRKPAQMLVGVNLGNGWAVLRSVTPPVGHTGGFFSHGYEVEHEDGRTGFLKALDFFDPLYYSTDPAGDLHALTEAFVYERDLHDRCADNHLSRVVRSIGHGTVRVEGFGEHAVATVQYLIFELAEGDVRSKLDEFQNVSLAWALRCLHHVATGLFQLHSIKVAHQDLKPSNVLIFEGGSSAKVGDLGRSSRRDQPAPHEDALVAGHRAYAPPELLYEAPPADWVARRFGCDAYLFGSMVVFMFTGLSATALLMKHLPEELHYHRRRGVPYEDVLPHLQQAFGDVLAYLEPNIPEPVRRLLLSTVRELCEPDPRYRGHPKNRRRGGNPYSLERYISRLDRAARLAEIHLKGVPV